MNQLQIKGNWNEIKGKLKQKYGAVIDDDSIFVEGKMDELVGRIEVATGKTKETILKEINDL